MRFFIGLVLLSVAACSSPSPSGAGTDGWQERTCRHARFFSVLERGDARRILVFGTADRSDTLADLRAGADGMVFDRLAALSTTHLPYLRALGAEQRIVAAAFIERSKDARLVERWKRGEVAEVATADGVDREQLAAARVDAVLDYPFGRSRLRATGGMGRFVPVVEYLEDHPLGRAEWIRFFGSLLGLEADGDSAFAMIERRYQHAVRTAVDSAPQPRVFFGSAWQGQWHVPPGGSYMARLITDAGGDYAFKDESGHANIALPLERVFVEARACDRFGVIMAHGGQVGALEMTGDARIAGLPVVSSGGFYLDSERSDVFGQALLEPDVLLRELRCVFGDSVCADPPHRYVLSPGQ